MDLQPPERCGKKGEGDCQSNEMAAPGRRFCRKQSLEVKGLDERKRVRKLAGGEEGSGCAKRMRMMSAEIGKKKVFGRSKEREANDAGDSIDADFLTGGVVKKGKGKGKDLLLFYEVKKGSNFEQGKEVVARRKKGEKKRFFGDEVKEPARLNRNSSSSSRVEKSSGIARKKTYLPSKHKDSGGRTTKEEATDTASLGMGKKRLTCHQCMHSFEKDVVVCSNCKIKRYCRSCVAKWFGKTALNGKGSAGPPSLQSVLAAAFKYC